MGCDCTECSRHCRCHWGGDPPLNSPPTPCDVYGGVLQRGDGPAAWGERLEQEAKAPISALPCVTSKRGGLPWGQSVCPAVL